MMTQAEYLSRLEYLLRPLPDDRKWELLDDIRQHFDEGIASGLSEEEIAEGLGAPELLAQEYTDASQASADHPAPKPFRGEPRTASPGILGRVWRGTCLFFLDLCVVLPVAITGYALWFAFLVTGASLVLAGALSAILVPITRIIPISFLYIAYPLLTFVTGLTATAIGLLILIGLRPMRGWLSGLTGRFLRWHGRFLRGGNAHDAK